MKRLLLILLGLIPALVFGQVTASMPVLVSPPVESSVQLPSGCIAYYKFENNTDDEQSTYDGTLVDGAGYDSDSVECGSYSLVLDGTDDAFNCGQVNTGGDFTLAMWLNLSDRGQNQYIMANRGGNTTQDGWNLRLDDNDGITFQSGDGSDFDYRSSTVRPLEYDQWAFLVATISKTDDEVQYFYNNVDVTPASNGLDGSVDFATSGQNLYIGALTNSSWECQGYVDEVMIFNRVLTGTEISDLYTNVCDY
jgi:hypothetical protein